MKQILINNDKNLGPKSQWLFLLIIVLVSCDCFRVLGSSPWMPTEKVKNRRVVQWGRFAVLAHNRMSHTNLKFKSVVYASTHVIRKIVHIRMVIKAKDGKAEHKYNVSMYEDESNNITRLIKFTRIE